MRPLWAGIIQRLPHILLTLWVPRTFSDMTLLKDSAS